MVAEPFLGIGSGLGLARVEDCGVEGSAVGLSLVEIWFGRAYLSATCRHQLFGISAASAAAFRINAYSASVTRNAMALIFLRR